jgi:hypothetical protein
MPATRAAFANLFEAKQAATTHVAAVDVLAIP